MDIGNFIITLSTGTVLPGIFFANLVSITGRRRRSNGKK